jgi:ribonuclease BN (tRNA processing enzyme)
LIGLPSWTKSHEGQGEIRVASPEVRVRFFGSGDAFGDGGRFQACILVETLMARILLDCGSTSLTAMKQVGEDPSSIDAVIVSHYHADHYGGIPFLILDGQFRHRTRPLLIAGPGDVERRVSAALEAAFPGASTIRQPFPMIFRQIEPGREVELEVGRLLAFPAAHTPGSDAVSLRVQADRALIGYTGDTEWTDDLRDLAAGADLLICEAYTWAKRVRYHLDYQTLASHRAELGMRRLILTHPGPGMLDHLADAEEETAQDGLLVTLGG